MPCRSVETRDEPKAQIQPATCQHRQEKLLHKLLHTPPPNSLSSILNCARFQILTPAQTSKYTQNPTTSFSHAPSPGQAPASLIWTKAVLFAVLVPGSRPSSHSLSSLKQPPEGAREHLSQAPPPLLPTALQALHSPQSLAQPGRSPPSLSSSVSPLAYSAPAAWGFWLFCQHIRPGPCPGPLHRLCPLSRPLFSEIF